MSDRYEKPADRSYDGTWHIPLNNNFDAIGDDVDALRKGNEIIAPSVAGASNTLAEAVAALPAAGGVIQLAETCTETADISVSKRIKLVGTGGGFDRDAPAHIDLGGFSLHLTSAAAACTFNNVQFRNGGLIIGETNQFGGRHTFRNVTIRDSPAVGVEFRGGHLNGLYDVSVKNAGGWGWLFNLDGTADYFNHNLVYLMCHGCANGVRMVGETGTYSQIHGNDWPRWDVEEVPTGGTGWDVEPTISLRNNVFGGYGIHDGALDVTPHGDGEGNLLNWYWAGRTSGGTFDFPGEVWLRDDEMIDLTKAGRTVHHKNNGHQTVDYINATGSAPAVAEWEIVSGGTRWARVGKLSSTNDRFYLEGNGVSEYYVSGGDFYLDETTNGFVTRSPNGTRYRINVADDGSLTTTQL